MPKCVAPGCGNTSDLNVRMCRFPANLERRQKWIESSKVSNLPKEQLFCEYHFAPDQWEKLRVDGTKKLKYNAVPTIFGDLVHQVTRPSTLNHQSHVPVTYQSPLSKLTYSSPVREEDVVDRISLWGDRFLEVKEKLTLAERKLEDTASKIEEAKEKYIQVKKMILNQEKLRIKMKKRSKNIPRQLKHRIKELEEKNVTLTKNLSSIFTPNQIY